MRKFIAGIVAAILCGLMLVFLVYHRDGLFDNGTLQRPAIEQVRALSELVACRVNVSDVLESRITGLTGGVKAAVVVHGDALISTDLDQASFMSINETQKTAVLELPAPHVLSARVDHIHTQIYSIDRTGLWHLAVGDQAETTVVDRAFRDAQQAIVVAADRADYMMQARRHVEEVIRRFYQPAGWTIEIRWLGS